MNRATTSLLALTTALAIAAPAFAQDSGDGEEVIVTGTRATNRTALDTAAPVDVISAQTLSRIGTTELSQALTVTLPSFDFPRPAITDGTDSVRPATLRGLAPDQTLVLVNSHRRHTSALVNINGSIGRGSAAVDLNTIPTIAISSVEVLRDGASAQYGSDALSGVINLRLREASEGGGATVTFGQYFTDVDTTRLSRSEEDGFTYTIAAWQGFSLPNDGFLTLSGEWLDRDPTSRGDRDPRITSPAQSPTGSLVTSRFGDPDLQQATFYLNAAMPLGIESWELYSWIGYQARETNSAANPRLGFPGGVENTASNVASILPTGFLPLISPTITDTTAALGVRGDIGGFHVDLGTVYGKSRIEYVTADTLNVSYARAQVTPGLPDNPLYGTPVQRSFDSGTLQYEQWVTTLGFNRTFNENTDTPVTLAFGLEYRAEGYFEGPGERGSWDVARDSLGNAIIFPGLATQPQGGSQGFPGLQPGDAVDSSRNAWSAYAEGEANVTANLLVSLAARYENYSDFGETLNGKISARYDFTDWFALRGTVSSGFRAPSLQQSLFTATSTNFINGIPVDVLTTPASSPLAAALGGTPLQPEESINYSVGGVFRAGGLQLTVDAYEIDITDRIVLSENIQGSATGTPTQIAIYNLIHPLSPTASAARFFINGVDTVTKGVDIVAHYTLPWDSWGQWSLTGSANFNNTDVRRTPTTTVLSSLPVPPVLFPVNRVLEFERGTPEQKYSLAVDWDLEPLGGTLRITRYGDVLVPQTTVSNTFKLDDAYIVDLEGRASWNGVNFALGANNLLDEYPTQTPIAVNPNGPTAFSSFSPFGFSGRFVYGRISYNW